MTKLTDKQEVFCKEYIIDFNATRAAKLAGYSDKTACKTGSENLQKPDIQQRIKELTKDRNERTQVTADRVVQELAKIAFSNIDDLGAWDDEGRFLLKNSEQLDDDTKASIKSITGTTTTLGEGMEKHEIKLVREDKIKALEMLARHTGAFNNDESGKSVINVTMGKKK